MATLTYAGIGARATPTNVLADMTVMSGWLARTGWHLASGGADGADSAFAAGAPAEQRTVWLPWRGYSGGAITDTGGRTAGCCLLRRCRGAWRSRPRCIPPGTGVRPPSGSCMRGTCRSCSARPSIGRSMPPCAGLPRGGVRAGPAWPSVSPRPTAYRCSISGRCHRGRPASGWPRSAGPPPRRRAGDERPPGECPAGRRERVPRADAGQGNGRGDPGHVPSRLFPRSSDRQLA